MMQLRRVNIETLLYLIALILALVLRLYNLGAAPLSESEAEWALQALQLSKPVSEENGIINTYM